MLQYPRWIAHRPFSLGCISDHSEGRIAIIEDLAPKIPDIWEGPCLSFSAWAKSQCLFGARPDFGRAGPRPPGSPAAQPWLLFPRRPLQVPSQTLPSAAQIHFSNTAAKDRRTPHYPLKIWPSAQAGTPAEERMFPGPGSPTGKDKQLGAARLTAQRLELCWRSWVGGREPRLQVMDLISARTEYLLTSTL